MESVPYYAEPLSYDQFLKHHLLPNLPALIGPALTKDWKARQKWVEPLPASKQGENQPAMQPCITYLQTKFGSAQVTVADCETPEFNDMKRTDMSFGAFVTELMPHGRYYLKDWHFCRDFPDYKAYSVPDLFQDDWLNEYWSTRDDKDDYRFVYIGGDATFTPIHADVYRSYSWSSNICGIKKWTLFPPGEEKFLKDKLNNYCYDIRSVDPVRFPEADKARRIVLYQRDGETLFVPSGWFHQVENIGMTISINQNWSNACNLEATFKSLSSDFADVKRSIADVQELMSPMEFVSQSQLLLRLHSGWDWSIFLGMIHCVAHRLSEEQQQRHQECQHQPDATWQVRKIRTVLDMLMGSEGEKVERYLEEQGHGSWLRDIDRALDRVLLKEQELAINTNP
ncbi:hypothetical protein BX666DRAFT_1964004 [Dichotomocladium elegans]|nr:hypothetical protein BX666DRAFT_1964004 [Dichotomocladium elegans]